MGDMPRGHGSSSVTTGKAVVVESSHEQGALSSIVGEVSTKKDEAIPSLAGEAIGDRKSLLKTVVC